MLWEIGRPADEFFGRTFMLQEFAQMSNWKKKPFVYTEGDYTGVRYDSKEVAGSDELFVYGGFQKKSREFVDSLIAGKALTSSPFSDALKTMEVCETILAQALIRGE